MSTRGLSGWLVVSVAVNVVLGVALALIWQPDPPLAVTLVRPPTVTNLYQPLRTNVVVQARPLRWRDLESTNYFTYIANLRSFGCPEPTIRDLISAEIDGLFAERRAREVVTPAQQWWRADPDPAVAQLAQLQIEALEAERRGLLERLLGPAADPASPETAAQGHPLDGPVLSQLDAETRTAVREIEAREQARLQTLMAGDEETPPSPPDPAELALLEARTRAELAAVLSPEALEEYLLRYSRTASQLRQQTREFEPTPEEFRALFRAIDPLNEELTALEGDRSERADQRRVELLATRQAAIEDALSAGRYAEYQRSQDPGFQAVRDTVEQLNLPESRAQPIYEINQVTREERLRILNDDSLTPEQQTRELASIEQQRLASLRQLLGDEAFRRLQSQENP